MATKLSAAIDRMRRHLGDSIPDSGDRQKADGYLRDVLQAMQEGPGEEDDGEEERLLGERLTGVKTWPKGQGLDAGLAFDRKPPGRAISSSLGKVLGGAFPPRSALAVR